MYFSTIEKSLNLCYWLGLHPRKRYDKTSVILYFGNLVLVVLMTILLVLQFVYDAKPITILNITDLISCLFIMYHGIVKATTIFVKKEDFLYLLESTKTNFWQIDRDNKTSINTDCERILTLLEKTYTICICTYAVTFVSFIAYPMFSSNEILIYECYRPVWFPYYPLLFYEQYIGLICTLFSILPMDMLFVSITMLTTVQFKLLNGVMKDLFEEKYIKGNDEAVIRSKIAKCVDHHIFLKNYVKRINETFSISLLIFLAIILLSMCMEMYRVSTQSDFAIVLRAFLYTSIGIFEFMAYYCLPSQILVDEADKLSESIYYSNWTKCMKFAKPLLMMVMAAGQKKTSILACGIISIDLKTGLDTIKSMISYSMFLKTMTKSEELKCL